MKVIDYSIPGYILVGIAFIIELYFDDNISLIAGFVGGGITTFINFTMIYIGVLL